MMPASILATSRLGAAGAAITFSMIIPRDIILRRSDVFYTLRSRPAVRNDLEIPLRIGKTLGRIEDIFPCGFEELQGLVLVRLRELLRARADPVQDIIKVQQITRANGAEMRFIICAFPKIGIRGSPKRFPEICEGHGEAARWRVECAQAGISLRGNTALETSAAIITRQRASEAVTVKKVRTSVIGF